MERRIPKVITLPAPAPGFIGPGHLAVEVVTPDDLPAVDPFVLLMDDRLDIPTRRQVGGAHPHAGIETVTFVLEGTLNDRDEGALATGDVLWMTAGRGIIHNESAEAEGRSRILQLWIRLPASDRSMEPRFELVRKDDAPARTEPGVTARLYSGTTGTLRSPTQNRAPITFVDIVLQPDKTFVQELPRAYNGFVYVLDGAVEAGGAQVERGQIGWLDRPLGTGDSTLTITSSGAGARVVLYAGEPQHEPLVHHGPFVAGSPEEIQSLFYGFRRGTFASMDELARRAAAPKT